MTRTKVGDRERINFYFDRQVLEALKKIAILKNTSYSELIRIGMREFVLREAQRAIDSGLLIKETAK